MRKHTLNGVTWTTRKRRGLPVITPPMMEALLVLRDAAAADAPFIPLPEIHPNTMRSLIARDWIFESVGSDGTRYKITGRGLKALKVYEPTLRRTDGICPDCGENPKHVTESGRVEGYCTECLRQQSKREYHLGIGKNPDTLCPRCKKRPRHRQPGGTIITYCQHCDLVKKRAMKRKKRRQQMKLLKRGGFIKCRKQGCEACVHYTDSSVYERCREHEQEYMIAYNDRRRSGSTAAKKRRTKHPVGPR